MRRLFVLPCLFALALISIAVLHALPVHAQSIRLQMDTASLAGHALQANVSLPDMARFTFEDAAAYTGIVIDTRQFSEITRSMSPAIYGPSPDYVLVYPDRSHVPTPDEVQDESIVRYYHTLDDAAKASQAQTRWS